MHKKPRRYRLIAKTLTGLEEVLERELIALGGENVRVMNRSVEFHGDTELLYRANLWCRTATRILKPVRTFKASNSDQLYKHVKAVDWSRFIDADSTLAVDSAIHHSAFDNSMFVSQRVKDAVVDQFRKSTGRRPSVDTHNPDLRLNVHIHESQATLSLDSSGEPLHRRGWRTQAGPAPLNEVLAAGIIALSGWDGVRPLVDGMCGSGTLVIEAATAARNIAPGLGRQEFGFMRWKDFDSELFRQLRLEARSAINHEPTGDILGSDSDATIVAEARANASRAGVAENIRLECQPFERLTPPAGPGVLVMNPPYGERMEVANIAALYTTIGDTLKQRYEGYNAFILTGNLDAAKRVGLRTSRRTKLFNGPLECRLLKYEMYSGSKKGTKNLSPDN